MGRLGIQAKLSTAAHPESDGQTERVNSIIEQYLRCYVNYQQDDWDDWTSLVEFSYNNATSESTHASPFLAVYRQHPRLGFEPETEPPAPISAHRRTLIQDANQFANQMSELTSWLQDNLAWAQQVYTENANQSRTPAPAYEVGDFM
jgi:hypothetical protein